MASAKDITLEGDCRVDDEACTIALELHNGTEAPIWSLHLDPGGERPWPFVQAAGEDGVFVAFGRPRMPPWIQTAQPVLPTGLPIAPGERIAFGLVLPLPICETALASRVVDPLAVERTLSVRRVLVGIEIAVKLASGKPFRWPGGGHSVAALAKSTTIAWTWLMTPTRFAVARLADTPDALGEPPRSVVDHVLPEDRRRSRIP